MQQSARFLSRKETSWKVLHSLWICWTFTFGIFGWVAFAYVGIRARHPRWIKWATFYAVPIVVFAVFSSAPQQWVADTALAIAIILGFFSIFHAFWIRKEYLLRLEMLEHQVGSVSATSRGKRWERLHSLWMLWTLSFGFTSWIAFLYIGIRTRHTRWILWGVFYFAVFLIYVISEQVFGQQSEVTESLIGLLIVTGVGSIVHAFSVRSAYLVRLENKIGEEFEVHRTTYPVPQPEQTIQVEEPPREQAERRLVTPQPEIPNSEVGKESTKNPRQNERPSIEKARASVPDGPETTQVSETYPLPLAYSWSLLASLWNPRDRYREQFRHAENVLAYLGSVSLTLLDEDGYREADIDPRIPWQGGISFGGWKTLVQRSSKAFRKSSHPLATSIHRLNIASERKGFGADMARLISMRNDYHHGRGPVVEEDIAAASEEAQQMLQRCMQSLSFLADYPLRLVQDFDLDRGSDNISLKCLKLMGDGPGFPQEKVEFPRLLPRNDLVLDIGDGEWLSLFPFLVVSNCSTCRYRETYFMDRWNDRKGLAAMKSFERGHAEERKDVSDALFRLSARQNEGSVTAN